MRKILALGLLVGFYFLDGAAQPASPPQQLMIKPKGQIVCYASGESKPVYLPPPAAYERAARTQLTNIVVDYVGFPSDNLAKNAFQRAVDIWAGIIQSPVTIYIYAEWKSLPATTLGQAIYGNAFANFTNAPKLGVFYPVALAEKLAGRALNPPPTVVNGNYRNYDIYASFNSDADWAYLDDLNSNVGRYNLTTVVLHEIGHGLGLTDSFDVTSGKGSFGVQGTTTPIVFDIGVENGANNNARLLDQTNNSTTLGSILVNRNINYNPALSLGGVAGNRAKLFAPTPWNGGSSIAHLDQTTYTGTQNMLMRPQLDKAQITLDPGPIVLNMFADMGWVSPAIDHKRLTDTETTNADFLVSAVIKADGTAGYSINNNVKIRYTINGGAEQTADMVVGANNTYTFSLPKPTVVPSQYSYYLITTDAYNSQSRTFTTPGSIIRPGQPDQPAFFQFVAGPDKVKPVIQTTPVDFIQLSTTSIKVQANVTDNIGVATVSLTYQKNNGAAQTVTMAQDNDTTFIYRSTIPTTGTAAGDVFTYRITATDVAAIPNTATAPSNGNYSVLVLGPVSPLNSYSNNFSSPSTDFFGSSYSITTPAGFTKPAIHSQHPYEDGNGPNNESNYVYQLRSPIKISVDNPYMVFDEIVLVEPGETGSVFGDSNFWDYVIVEGSVDNGVTWKPFLDGYDSRANAAWLSKWNSSIIGQNSTAIGDPSLYRTRLIKLTNNGNFKANDLVSIRFRLFADEAAHGWGWAIDNLFIQSPITEVEKNIVEKTMSVYPNPAATETIFVSLETLTNDMVDMQVYALSGAEQVRLAAQPIDQKIEKEINIAGWNPGLYFLKANVGGSIVTRKFVVLR